MTPEGAFAEWVGSWLAIDERPERVGVAISGGGDSVALLHLAFEAFSPLGVEVRAVTVDHGLRPESAAEAVEVARTCDALGVRHDALRWDGTGTGNLQERAREARRRLIGAWARAHGVTCVLLGHTADDQAETVLLRLARGSGVDGLAAMVPGFRAEGVFWQRPLLGVTREVLRDWLRSRGVAWIEDPSNDDPRFDRVRARAMMAHLGELGLTRERLLRTAGHMLRARATLISEAGRMAVRQVQEDGSDLLVSMVLMAGLDRHDSAGRILSAALMWVGGTERRPRWTSLRRMATLVRDGRSATLSGCLITPEGDWARVAAEARNARAPRREPHLRFVEGASFG